MARGRTLAKGWMGTPDEVDFAPDMSYEIYIFYEKKGSI
jgi:hypothetical protein